MNENEQYVAYAIKGNKVVKTVRDSEYNDKLFSKFKKDMERKGLNVHIDLVKNRKIVRQVYKTKKMKAMTKQEFLKRATAKNIKQMRGHDAPSFEWDIYFDGKKICNCWDDSYGGELDITNYDNQSIEDIYKSIDKDSLYDKEYKWTTSIELLMYELKTISLMKKDEKKGVMIGKPTSYSIVGFQASIPTTFKKWSKEEVMNEYQKIINDAVKKGQTILNVDYLKTWNLKV